MTQQQAVPQAATAATVLQIDRRTPERVVLHFAIEAQRALEKELDAARTAVSDFFDQRSSCRQDLHKLRESDVPGAPALLEKITRALESGFEPSIRYFNDAEEQLGSRVKSLLQDVELYARREAELEASIPDKERAVSMAKRKVEEAVLDVIRASSAVAMAMNELEILKKQVTEKCVQLHYFISRDIVDDDDAAEARRLLAYPVFPANWRAHPDCVKWAGALERLLVDADAELPCG